ncbi:uncharacterized protein A1O9_03139 [Exophiala aquamarina CBS 119918]|uniref:Uncharacterized protein n=1 Tax=Exophiala aquamarina CBS 119918 TaxID=1182545 RepID=A0A072PNV3_9EURO|nr:uncharacterized protein A1O9_03139 [Exophiala aquamarina CBS 119918]KEF61571.1 hypothetical protein A1O9_03139 [Exophiala aquamarina CBS 119918]
MPTDPSGIAEALLSCWESANATEYCHLLGEGNYEGMELASAGVSLTAFVGITDKLLDLHHQFKHARDELELAGLRIEQLSINLDLLQKVDEDLLSTDEPQSRLRDNLKETIVNGIKSIAVIQNRLPKAITKSRKRNRIRWVLLDRITYGELMTEVMRTENSINTALHLIQWLTRSAPTLNTSHGDECTSLRHLERDEQLGSNPIAILERRQTCEPTVPEDTFERTSVCEGDSAMAIDHRHSVPRRPWSVTSNYFWDLCNLTLMSASAGLFHRNAYVCSVQLDFLARISLKINLILQSRAWNTGFRFPFPATITLTSLIPTDSPFMTACSDGDISKIRALLQCGLASPIDMTDKGETPLSRAIENGHISAVKVLLESGADVNEPFGQKHTSALCWAIKHRHLDICRLLIQRGASYHHLTMHGWSALFYLWPGTEERHPLSSDLINLLRNEGDFSFLHQGIIDAHSWGLIHRASIFGKPSDLELLMAAGVDPFQPIGNLGWTTIHNVVDYGVHDNFLVLFPAYTQKYGVNPARDLHDSRGWSLLHIAIASIQFNRGHRQIIRSLLELGANPHAQTELITEDNLESLRGSRCSSLQLALAFGKDRHLELLSAINDSMQMDSEDDSPDEGQDIWHDSVEVVTGETEGDKLP